MPVFNDRDLAFWEENGYIVLTDAVPKEHLAALVETVWDFLEMDPDDRDDWYKWKPYDYADPQTPICPAGMVSLYQHQTLWDNRQYPRVYEAFTEILGTRKLWVSLDRTNMKPPARADRPEWGHTGMVHWDVDTSQTPIPFGVSGGAIPDGYSGKPGWLFSACRASRTSSMNGLRRSRRIVTSGFQLLTGWRSSR